MLFPKELSAFRRVPGKWGVGEFHQEFHLFPEEFQGVQGVGPMGGTPGHTTGGLVQGGAFWMNLHRVEIN